MRKGTMVDLHPPIPPEITVLWQGTCAWEDITTGKQRRCPACIIEVSPCGPSGFVGNRPPLSVEFADMPQYPDMWANWDVKLYNPEPPVPAELLERLENEHYRGTEK